MADIAQDAKIRADEPFLEGFSKLSTHLWDTAWQHAAGTARGDADDLHDMRVALRRLRSALQNFAAPELVAPHLCREIKAWRRRIGKIGDALGAVRDFDVLDDYLKIYAKTRLDQPLALAPGLVHFERWLQSERALHFAPMVQRLNRAAAPSRLREEFARWALGLPAADGPIVSVSQAAHLILPQRLDEVQAHAGALEISHADEEQHELRKALRRVRYTLEIFTPCWDGGTKEALKSLVQMQDVLGEMQDRAVLRASATRAFKNYAGRRDESENNWPADMQHFMQYGERRRSQLLGQIRRLWQQHNAADFWERLRNC